VTKNEIRQKLLADRLALTEDKVRAWSDIIQDHILKSPLWPSRGRVGLYFSTKNEVLTYSLFQRALEQGLHVYFPRVEQGLGFYEVNGPEDLQRGAWAIMEPLRHCLPIPPEEKLDLLVVPGVVFTKDGYRLGYGRGFYDRIVDDIAKSSVGIAYDFQLVESVPLDEWDKRLDAVITEKHVYRNEAKAKV
jgi:5-formyltetrahydrofolate cyclo-ligase